MGEKNKPLPPTSTSSSKLPVPHGLGWLGRGWNQWMDNAKETIRLIIVSISGAKL